MSLIQTDTKRMAEDGEALFFLANRYIQYINQMKSIIKKQEAWKGIDADNFKSDVVSSYEVYDEVGVILKEYATFLMKSSQKIDMLSSKDLIE